MQQPHAATTCRNFEVSTASLHSLAMPPPDPAKNLLTSTGVSPRAWHTIGIDLFTQEVSSYLVVGDHYSKQPFAIRNYGGKSKATQLS